MCDSVVEWGMSQSSDLPSRADKLMATVASLPIQISCPRCGSKLTHVETTFFSSREDRKAWKVLMPICPKCDGEDSGRVLTRRSTVIRSNVYAVSDLLEATANWPGFFSVILLRIIHQSPVFCHQFWTSFSSATLTFKQLLGQQRKLKWSCVCYRYPSVRGTLRLIFKTAKAASRRSVTKSLATLCAFHSAAPLRNEGVSASRNCNLI